MKALLLQADKELTYTDIDIPKRNGLRVRVSFAGICGSDIERGFHGKAYHYPLVMGHEFCGVLEEDGSVLKKGARVAVFPLLPCRKCPACETGDYAQCTDYDYLGSRSDGGFAGHVCVPEENLLPVPDHVKMEHAAMAEPCAVALHGVSKFDITPCDSACVFGGGPIGNLAAQWLRVRGCKDVYIVELDQQKRSIADAMGFTAIDPQAGDVLSIISERTGGRLIDHVVEACGYPETFLNAVKCASVGGEVLFMGNIRGSFVVPEKDFSQILRKELSIYGTWNSKVTPAGRNDWSTSLAYIDNGISCAPLISHIVDLKDGAAMFDTIVAKREFVNKAIFRVSEV